MSTWRLGSLLFLLGLGIGLGLGYTIGSGLPIASAQSDETVRLLRSIDERLRQISRNVENLDRNIDRVRDWDAIRVRVRQ
ncbi:MAG: hypothetical protein SLRJCFUN_002319 [Candidatus Fervidibacter sp.]|jgi:hypothetical protein